MKHIIHNRKIMIFFVGIIFLAGIYSYYNLPKQEAPNISPPVAIITTVYPGASQENVENLVTSKIEDEIMTLDGYSYSKSYSSNSFSTVILEVEYGVDIDKTWDDLRTKMIDLQNELPSECQTIGLRTDLAETAGIIIAITGEGYSYEALSGYSERFIDELSMIDGVKRFEMDGKIEKEVLVSIDMDALNRLDLSYSEIIQVIKGQNLEIPSGFIEGQDNLIPLNIRGSFESIEEIEGIIIGMSDENMSVLRLGDISTISLSDSDSGKRYKNNGNNAILLSGYFKQEENVLIVGKEVRAKIDEIKKELPEDIQFVEVIFQPTDVSKSINNFMLSLLQGIILVIIVVFIGMGFRNAIIVSTAIPLAIAMTFLAMPFFDIQIQDVSIIALIVALGMLVDNAIVVSDSIQHKLDRGVERMEACVGGAKEVLVPVFSSTLTTIATLSPLMLLNSIAGDYIKSLPMVVIIALTSSFIIAIVVTPTFAFIFFKPSTKEMVHHTHTWGYKLLSYVLGHKVKAFFACILIFVMIGSSGLLLEVIFFPKADKDIMYIDVVSDQNIDLDYTETISNQIETILEKEAGIIEYTTAIGGGLPKFFTAMNVYAEIPQNAQIMFKVDLSTTKYKKNTDYADYLQNKINSSLLGGKATVKELENAFPSEAAISIRFTGEDFEEINKVTHEIKSILNAIEGTKNVRTDYTSRKLEYAIALDADELSVLGMTKYDVLNEVSIALRGRQASTYRADGHEYDIIIEGDNGTIDSINNLMVKSSITGNKYLLKDIGQLELVDELPTINKYNGLNAIMVYSNVQIGYQRSAILEELESRMDTLDYGDVDYKFDGEEEEIISNFGSAGVSAIFALFAIYAILLIQFKSFKQPFIILFTVPLSSAGAILGLFIMNQPISFTGLIGIISLIGIVVNNAIVLLDYINLKRADGMSIEEACKNASVVRFRPIVLSSITTISGLLPLLISNSELFKPMAVSLVFGLLVSTILTLVLIPLTYSIFVKEDRVV